MIETSRDDDVMVRGISYSLKGIRQFECVNCGAVVETSEQVDHNAALIHPELIKIYHIRIESSREKPPPLIWEGDPDDIFNIKDVLARQLAKLTARDGKTRSSGLFKSSRFVYDPLKPRKF